MALQYSGRSVGKMAKRFEGIQNRLSNMKKKTEKATEKIMRTATASATAFGAGVLQGRTGGVEVVGVPVELGAGSVLSLLGLLGAAGKHSEHLSNVGDGLLCAYAATLGRGVGETMRRKQGSLPAGGARPIASRGVRLTPEEIAAAAELANAE